MAVPKKKVSKSRRNMRRSHHAIKAVNTVTCERCGAARLPHCICPECGFYAKNGISYRVRSA